MSWYCNVYNDPQRKSLFLAKRKYAVQKERHLVCISAIYYFGI
jgi:hypothetical protein